jgi:HAD superfamily hydrolase (TIGR01549 family)
MAAPIVVFDLDNTLVHSHIDFLGIRLAVIERLCRAGALAEPPADPRVRAIPEWLDLAAAHDPLLARELWELVDAFEREGMLRGTVEPDTRRTLDELRAAGFRLAVLTNNSLASGEAALRRVHLREPLDCVLARGVVPALKPSGAGVAQAHRALGGGPTFVVGDSAIDGLAAQRARVGARFVAFRADLPELARRGVQPWAAITALAELPALLGCASRD